MNPGIVIFLLGCLIAAWKCWTDWRKLRKEQLLYQEAADIAPMANKLARKLTQFLNWDRAVRMIDDTPDEELHETIRMIFGDLSEKQYAYLFDGKHDREDCLDIIQTNQQRILDELPPLLTAIFEKTWLLRGQVKKIPVPQEKAKKRKYTTKKSPRKAAPREIQSDDIADIVSSFNLDIIPDGTPQVGPSVTCYYFRISQGVKLSKITGLADDIALALGASGVRITPVSGRSSVVGIEIPNKKSVPVLFSDIVNSDEFKLSKSPLTFALGKDVSGKIITGNLEALPHVLIAGTTGSGKSICLNVLICSLILNASPEQLQFLMIDPKMVELAPYQDIPHLAKPVVTDAQDAAAALNWAVEEMLKRYEIFKESGTKGITEYKGKMPYLVIIIDEMADLMSAAKSAVEESVMRLAQMGRAAGIHLIIVTQRPTTEVVTGLIKANIPSRIALSVSSALESRIILDRNGAEKLQGRGDMIYAPQGGENIRVQGCFITDEDIEKAVKKWTAQRKNTVSSVGE